MKHFLNKPKEEYSWVKYIKHRISLNKNFLGITTGPTGSGKSWMNLSMGELLDDDFSVDRVVFSPLELMKLITGGTLKSGSVIVFEEVGVNMSSAQWQSAINKMLNFLFQTFRSMNFILLMNAPYKMFADKRIRILIHAQFAVTSIDRKRQETVVLPRLQQYNENKDKIYPHKLRMVLDNGNIYEVDEWGVPKPSDDLINAYEDKKRDFNDKLNNDIMRDLEELEKGPAKNLTSIQEETLKLLKEGKNPNEIGELLNQSPNHVADTIKRIRAKGFKIQAIKEGTRILRYEVAEI